jgi:2-oxo-4-hydroxy-4-carboxy-5-ureidoimidazoline decarboxylase
MSITRDEFLKRYGGVYEHSSWIAEAAFDAGRIAPIDTLHAAMKQAVIDGTREQKLALIRAHPDLAGRLALTRDSESEQKGAGLDQCSPAEFEEFQRLNDAYKKKFGFPFIIAVKGHDRQSILENFRKRIDNDEAAEFETALEQIHRIARFRLEALQTS